MYKSIKSSTQKSFLLNNTDKYPKLLEQTMSLAATRYRYFGTHLLYVFLKFFVTEIL